MGYVLTKNELYHHGILGQKWGQRRFQNPDGTYTAEGKERRRINGESLFKAGKDGKPSRAEKATRSASEIVTSTQNIRKNVKTKAVNDAVKSKTKDISQMSNKELQDVVNRFNLEQQYKNVIRQQEEMKRGQDTVDTLLSNIGSVLGIASSAASLFAILWQIKHSS